jgi:hypothetical protein
VVALVLLAMVALVRARQCSSVLASAAVHDVIGT